MAKLVVSYRFSPWRRWNVSRFLGKIDKNFSSKEALLNFLNRKGLEGENVTLLVWGTTLKDEGIEIPKTVEVIRLEDGFIRSRGLGIKLTPPISLVADRSGIYYDATEPSDLENLLNFFDFPQKLLERAGRLRTLLVERKITKYNLSERSWKPPSLDREIVVVPGQVETDKSIKYGSPKITTNLELLKKVREDFPNAYVVYKPHPDVVAKLRKGEYEERRLREYCDEVCIGCSSVDLIEYSDWVATLTSLFGFEALIRGKRVKTYGIPFYAGWGLTEDYLVCKRRKRKRSLDELVAAAIILYPMYKSLEGEDLTPEEAINLLERYRQHLPIKWKLWNFLTTILIPYFRLRRF
jgi:capsular polysaccharide export protein